MIKNNGAKASTGADGAYQKPRRTREINNPRAIN